MPIFSPDFTSVEASIPIYDKGRYRVKVTKKKGFSGESKDKQGNLRLNGGIQYNIEMVGKFDATGQLVTEDFMGRTVTPYKVWLHSDGGWQYGKPFLMAGAGYTLKEEQEANEKFFQGGDWMFNGDKDTPPENMEIGKSYDTPVGKLLDVNLDRKVQKEEGTDRTFENQEFGSWAPVK